VKPFACAAIALCLMTLTPARAQNQTVDDLKGKIFDARMAQQTFASGLKFCSEFDGKHFYLQVFNPEKHRPWTEQDAAERWDLVQKEAASDQADCQLVASLPALEKQLDELEKNPPKPTTKN
jgi:hypothetical protein